MCGIAGYFGRATFDPKRWLAALAHRGPDARGTWSTALGDGAALHFVHTRLKILDLSDAAAQPMLLRIHRSAAASPASAPAEARDGNLLSSAISPPSSDSTSDLALVFNGEIYNFRELRAELVARGHTFRSSGDTEVLLRGYAEWGTALFARCDGMFALAIFDGPRRRLVLARDHIGIKPLYVATTRDGGFAFASEVRALARSGLVDTAVDHDAVHDFLRLGSVQEPATIHAGIRAFPAGCFAEVSLVVGASVGLSRGGPTGPQRASPAFASHTREISSLSSVLRPQSYWSAESVLAGADNTPHSNLDWFAMHQELFARTVHEQIASDVPVGVFLSGGLDSTLLLEQLSNDDRRQLTAFTLGGAVTTNDEAALAGRTCANLDVSHAVVRPDSTEIAAWVADGLDAMDQPSCDGINTYLVSRASRAANLVVVLSGCGADELHGAYGHAWQLARFIRLVSAAGPLGAPIGRAAAAVLSAVRGPLLGERLRLMIEQVSSPAGVLDEKRRFFTPSQIAALRAAISEGASPALLPRKPHGSISCVPQEARDGLDGPTVRQPNGPTVQRSDISRPSSALRPSSSVLSHLSSDLRTQITIAELTGYLRNTLLRDSDWATMANHQEMRVPYLGRRYMEFLLRVPWHLKMPTGGMKKPLLGNLISAANRSLVSERKRGFVLNYRELLLGSQRDTFHVSCARLRSDLGFTLDADTALASIADRDRSGKRANRLWALLALGRYLGR